MATSLPVSRRWYPAANSGAIGDAPTCTVALKGVAQYLDRMAQTKLSPETQDLSDLKALIVRMRAGERRAISRAVTELERLSAAAPRLLEAMQPHLGHALVVGFTGPPGAGKSTLINAYTQHLRAEGKSVGIIAVDPVEPDLRRRHPGRSHPHDGDARRRRRIHALARQPRPPGRPVPGGGARDRRARCRR